MTNISSTLRSQEFDEIVLFPNDPLSLILLSLSIVSSLVVLVVCVVYKLYRQPLEFMVTWTTFAHVTGSVIELILGAPFGKTALDCKIATVVELFSDISTFHWTSFFGHALITTIKTQNMDAIVRYKLRYFLFGTIVPLFYSLVNFFQKWIDVSNNICVYRIPRQGHEGILFVLSTIPFYIMFGLCLWWYIRAIIRMRKELDKEYRSQAFVLLLFPGILIVCWLPDLVLNMLIYLQFVPSTTAFTVMKLLDYSQGFLDSMVYGISRNVFKYARKQLRKCRKRFNKNSEEESFTVHRMDSTEKEKLNQSLLRVQQERDTRKMSRNKSMDPMTFKRQGTGLDFHI